VQEAIAELRKGRTTLVIAHRLSTINTPTASSGRGRTGGGVGRHDELLRKGGRYASFYRSASRAGPELETSRSARTAGPASLHCGKT